MPQRNTPRTMLTTDHPRARSRFPTCSSPSQPSHITAPTRLIPKFFLRSNTEKSGRIDESSARRFGARKHDYTLSNGHLIGGAYGRAVDQSRRAQPDNPTVVPRTTSPSSRGDGQRSTGCLSDFPVPRRVPLPPPVGAQRKSNFPLRVTARSHENIRPREFDARFSSYYEMLPRTVPRIKFVRIIVTKCHVYSDTQKR